MTKYIVSGYIGFDNFGDEAIASVLVNKLKEQNAEKITLISKNPLRTMELHNVNSCGMLDFFNSLKEADVLISGGGSLLQDVTSLKSLIYYLGVIFAAKLLRKKVEIFAQGIGPIQSKFGQILTKIALKNVDSISVRDKKSQELLANWGINSELVKDPVFSLEIPKKNKKGIVGIQLRNFYNLTDDFLNALAKEITYRFPDKKLQIISLQDSIDLDVCNKFARILKENFNTENVEVLSKLSVNEVFEVISDLEYLIGMRFHANVAAIKSGIKTIVINYDIKVQKLAEEYNLPIIEMDKSDFSNEFAKII